MGKYAHYKSIVVFHSPQVLCACPSTCTCTFDNFLTFLRHVVYATCHTMQGTYIYLLTLHISLLQKEIDTEKKKNC